VSPRESHVWHQFVIRTPNRDKLISYLESHRIGTLIHYPIPVHLQECYNHLGIKKGSLPITEKICNEILSLPLYIGMPRAYVDYVCLVLNAWRA